MLVAACARTPGRVVPYQGEVQNVRTHGAASLARIVERDPAIARWVARHGDPDFVLVTSAVDVELIYYGASRLVHFHGPAGAPAVGELSPLPLEVANVLPIDLRAGTPGSIQPEIPPQTGCWTVVVDGGRCRTCCRSAYACSSECRASDEAR